jgi:hypothetical protein
LRVRGAGRWYQKIRHVQGRSYAALRAMQPKIAGQELFLRLGKAAVFVTHDLREAVKLGSRIVMLAGGRVEAVATVTTIGTATIPAALLALAADWGLGWIEERFSPE